LGYASIGLTGVNGFKDRTDRGESIEFDAPYKHEDNEDRDQAPEQLSESRVLPELELIGDKYFWNHRTVYIPFDSDIVHKWQVRNALKKLAEWLQSQGADVYIVLIPNELNGDKNGVDDFIVRHGVEAYEKLLAAAEPAFTWEKKKPKFNLPTDPGLFQKASLLWCVLKEDWRYRPGIGWHQWQLDHWELTDDGAGTYIDDDIYRFLAANGWKAQGNGSMANLIRHMKAKLMIKQWNPKHKIAFVNGVLDIDSRVFTHGHRREDFMTVALPYPYDPQAQCPTWKKFISEALKADDKAIDLVQAFFRWALLPKPEGKLDLEVGWDLYGRAGTGKGTTLETLKNIIGHHNCGHFSSKSISDPNLRAGLLDKRVSISADDSGHMEDFGLYGSIMSNETVLVKLLYKNVFPTTLNTFMVRAYNNFITTPSGAKGLDRRIVAMTFNQQPAEMDTNLQAKINAELSGVFNWAWNISNAEMKSRILWAGEVESVAEASTQMFLANNPIFVFLSEEYPEGAEKVRTKDLYYQYKLWAHERGQDRLGERRFCELIVDFGCKQLAKVDGYRPYYIPPFSQRDVLQEFGILRGKTKNTQIHSTAETAESREIREVREVHSSEKNVLPLAESQSSPNVEDESGKKGKKGKNFCEHSTATIFIGDLNTTENEASDKSNMTAPTNLELIEPLPITPINPHGTITYQAYVFGKIGNVKVNFKRKEIAIIWRDAINLKTGYRGRLVRIYDQPALYQWQIVYKDFDRDALTELESWDLSRQPWKG
jgi:putative DNA primase/helicase